jgi:putative ABC transport system permease protein
MLNNFLQVALRNIYRNSFYSLINIAGLASGLACSILILLWVADELSFNRFHENYERLYRVHQNMDYSGEIATTPNAPYPLNAVIKDQSPHIRRAAIATGGEGNLFTAGDHRANKWGQAVSGDFLRMFTFEVVSGAHETALDDPSSIVITESMAKSFFGSADPIGKTLIKDHLYELRVTSVIRDLPAQSTFEFDYLISMALLEQTEEWLRDTRDVWLNNSFQEYIELDDAAAEEDVNKAISGIVSQHVAERYKSQVFLHPAGKWRLYSDFENGEATGGMIEYVRLFAGIAVLILLIACINFMNLATARSEKRAREVGIRKSVGSSRRQLVLQFLGESLLVASIGFVLAMILVEVALPAYNQLVNKQLSIPYSDPLLWSFAIGLLLVTGLVAGSYPAFFLSGFQAAKVLKGTLMASRGGSTPRKTLVALQFGFSIFLIIGTLVIYQQVMHVKSREIGYDRENLMLLWTNDEVEKNYSTIKQELLRTGKVTAVAKSSAPITRIFSSSDVEWAGMDPNRKVGFITVATEYDYAETMGVKMLAGRDFSHDFPADSQAIVINKAAADAIGWEDPVGNKVKIWGDERTIIGVMENIIMGSPYDPVDPLALVMLPGWSSTISVRLGRTDLSAAIAEVESVFKKLNPSYPFSYRFADAEFETKFASINLTSRLAGIFAMLAILITCLGLFGLAAFTAEQRRKELSIRKVLGATVSGLILLISRDFSKLIMLSFLLVAPLAWYGLNSYLEQYPYRVAIAWWVIPSVGLFALSLGLIIVGTQAMRAARSNPVEALKGE